MRKEYRIKVEEQNDGEKSYIPQVGYPKLYLGKICDVWIEWKNLVTWNASGEISPSDKTTSLHYTEDGALKVINNYKKQLEDKEAKQIKKTTYINL